ncbi:HNH endonuclease [Yersinia enterocolitica]|uniref:HNH endonuclease signature motif containing protein n=2 Tax=Yersinia enterocolitica TaxID=630 RepID=UPI0005E24003|nr:HNH endonuclease [Yersinia enterocolitica]EKN3555571.1 HNH endonuclease [Yersinia enterocolitica]EKN4100266.1 HNH endonuclease [Yersinia enterocolitica]EKN6287976.1 HNH endonuclease [Yersinia enterocolitica]EKN6292963.1 HNH endonuclease [Yersinia enterocolitica]
MTAINSFAVCPLTGEHKEAPHSVPKFLIDPITNLPATRSTLSKESRAYARIYGATAITGTQYKEMKPVEPTEGVHEVSAVTYKAVCGRFTISEDSPSGIVSTRTGKPIGSKVRYWRIAMGTGNYQLRRDPKTGETRKVYQVMSIAAHRVVFMLAHKRDIKEGCVVVHINNDQLDNRPENLKEVSHSVAAFTRKATKKAESVGYVGVGYVKRRQCYVGRCKAHGKIYYTKGYQDIHACHRALEVIRKTVGAPSVGH